MLQVLLLSILCGQTLPPAALEGVSIRHEAHCIGIGMAAHAVMAERVDNIRDDPVALAHGGIAAAICDRLGRRGGEIDCRLAIVAGVEEPPIADL
jgi:hypothetical protein